MNQEPGAGLVGWSRQPKASAGGRGLCSPRVQAPTTRMHTLLAARMLPLPPMMKPYARCCRQKGGWEDELGRRKGGAKQQGPAAGGRGQAGIG